MSSCHASIYSPAPGPTAGGRFQRTGNPSPKKLPTPDKTQLGKTLWNIDDLLTAQSAKLSALRTHKKGLMQQLFPAPEEVQA